MTKILIEEETLKLALEALASEEYRLRQIGQSQVYPGIGFAITAITQDQTQTAQEPVGEVVVESMGVRGSDAMRVRMHFYKEIPPVGSKIYTTQPAAQPAVQDVAAYLFTNVQSGDIESSTDPDHKQDERELWYREELVRQHHHTKKGRP
jgi:hypothetical protein